MSPLSKEKAIPSYVPLPVCVIDKKGKVLSVNEKIKEVFIYDRIVGSDIFALTGLKAAELYSMAAEEDRAFIERNDKVFKIVAHRIEESEDSDLAVFFADVTSFAALKDMYNEEKLCIARLEIDNYEELMANMPAEKRLSLPGAVDGTVRRWARRINASINRVDSDSYIMAFEYRFLAGMIEEKFNVLDEIRALETGADFPASLSIGVGVGGKTPAETEEYADAALELALGRGGDQAVVKRRMKLEYFGGTLQSMEKRNKSKSRTFGHALKQLIEQSNKVFIMGHANPDMDCFGATLGIARLCTVAGKTPYIVIDNYKDALHIIFKQAKDSDEYRFINSERAEALADGDSLVIVLDTQKPSMVQCPALLDVCERVVVIDHHRRGEEFIETPILAYMESYASSTCELVTEILQYITDKRALLKLEAEALMAGMTVDTNSFAIKAGVRTFEAAAWLRRQGADPTEVRRFFQEEQDSFEIKADALAAARILSRGIAVSVCKRPHSDEQVICAQVADQLLTIRGVRASFVAGINDKGKTVVSARSLGEVNVQTIMENFGGGGHLTTAAAQADVPPEEILAKITEELEAK